MHGLKIGLALVGAIVVGTTGYVVWERRAAAEQLPIYGRVEPFQLVSQDNLVFQNEDLKGRVSIVNFIFTSCPGVCPMLTAQMKKIQEKTDRLGEKVRLVSISVDPARDTPEKLQQYGKSHGADFSRWTFLTGPLTSVRQVVVKSFMNAMGEMPEGEEPDLFEITHGENFVVVDGTGNIRAFRQAKSDRDIQQIVRIAQNLIP